MWVDAEGCADICVLIAVLAFFVYCLQRSQASRCRRARGAGAGVGAWLSPPRLLSEAVAALYFAA